MKYVLRFILDMLWIFLAALFFVFANLGLMVYYLNRKHNLTYDYFHNEIGKAFSDL